MPPTRKSQPTAPVQRPEPLALGLLLGVVLIAYANAFGLGFTLDGNQLVLADQRIRAFSSDNLRLIFTTDYWWPLAADRLFRPFTTLSFLADYSVLGHGTQPFGYHAVNILLHTVNSCLVFFLARRVLKAVWPAFFAAALWAVHPVGVDSVANLAGRADLLAAAGILGALLAYSRSSLPGVFLCSALAAFSKESGSVVLGMFLLWDLVPSLHEKPRRRAVLYLAAALPIAAYWILRARIIAGLPVPYEPWIDNPLRGASPFLARWTALKILAIELGLLLFPANLSADRSFRQIPVAGLTDPLAWIGLLAAVGILGFVILRRREQPLWFWAAGFFGLALLPSANLLVIIGAPLAERFLYVPAVAFAIAAVALVQRYAKPRNAAVILGIAVAILGLRTLVRNPDWNSNYSIAAHDVQVAPGSFRLHTMHGDFSYQQNRADLETPIRELSAATAILDPLPDAQNDPQVYTTLGFYYMIKGDRAGPRTPEGQSWYGKALPVLEHAAAIARAVQENVDAAQTRAGKAPTAPRPNERVFLTLGDDYRAVGRHSEALGAYRAARAIAPTAEAGYDGAASAALSLNDRASAARFALEKALALGATAKSVALVKQLYADVPGGDCAVTAQSGLSILNVGCPRLREDFCPALSDLSRSFTEARQPARARAFDQMGQTQFGCSGPR